jgi:hypothetical protein
MEQTTPAVQPEVKTLSGVSKVFNIFFEPRKVFGSLNVKPTWIVPVIIVALLAVSFFYFTFPYLIDQQVQRIRDNENIPEQAKANIIERIGEQTQPPIWQLAIAPVGVLVSFIVVAAVLFFTFNVLLGGDSTFRRVFSTYCYSSLVAIPASIVKFPLVMAKGNLNVQTSLALILSPDKQGSFIYSVLSSFDIFTVWQVLLLSIGLGVMYKFTTKKAMVAVFVLWIIWILLKSGLGSAFGGSLGF